MPAICWITSHIFIRKNKHKEMKKKIAENEDTFLLMSIYKQNEIESGFVLFFYSWGTGRRVPRIASGISNSIIFLVTIISVRFSPDR